MSNSSSSPAMVFGSSRPATAESARSGRINALDWTKGMLVLFMVVYHGINYSVFRPVAFQYLAFLPPSFILIAGFIVGHVYAAKYDLKSLTPYLRLGVRGLKLLVLFALLNLAFIIVRERSLYHGFWEFGVRFEDIFLLGNGRVGIFEVLLPIAYFLLLAPLLLWSRRYTWLGVPVVAAVLFALCLFVDSDNLGFLCVGVIGMAIGLIPMNRIEWLARKWPLVLLLYGVYRLISFRFGETFPVQTTAAVVSVLLLFAIGLRTDSTNWLGRQIVVLGNYSLFAYLAQIPLLRVLAKLWGGQPDAPVSVALLILLASGLLWVLVLGVDRLRKESRPVDTSYRAVFA